MDIFRLLSKVKNELKIYIMYICDFGIDMSINHVCILIAELFWILKSFSLKLRRTLWKELQKLSITKVYSVGFNHDAEILCKRIKHDLENSGEAAFSITAELGWYSLHQPKSDQISTHQNSPHPIFYILPIKAILPLLLPEVGD